MRCVSDAHVMRTLSGTGTLSSTEHGRKVVLRRARLFYLYHCISVISGFELIYVQLGGLAELVLFVLAQD